MSCSARLPVYALLLAALLPGASWKAGLALAGIYIASLMIGSLVAGLAVLAAVPAWWLVSRPESTAGSLAALGPAPEPSDPVRELAVGAAIRAPAASSSAVVPARSAAVRCSGAGDGGGSAR